MFRKLFSFCTFLGLIGFQLSCSTTKNGILNKEYHTITTKYNVLFNGKEAFAIGESILAQAFEDNFYELLPVEPLNLQGENFDETTIVPGFDRAEEKAVKAIQKHSIKINEEQYNRKIDEAYLLLGKARYFDRRFFPALEAFNFLLESGAKPRIFIEGKIWREKTNIRLRNIELAIENLEPLASSLSPESKFYPLANATLAEAFIQLQEMDSAATYIQKAAMFEPKRKNKARYLFITGQLLEAQEKPDSARGIYQQIGALKRKAPRNLLIQAKVKETLLAHSLDFDERIDELKQLLKNYENEPFEHRIERALAKVYLEEGEDSLALTAFDRSLGSSFLDFYTEIQNYQDLSSYYFEKGDYLKTGEYLDRMLPFFDEETSRYRRLKRERENLSEVILYEKTVKETDSILALIAMSDSERIDFFTAVIEEKQNQAKKELDATSEKKRFQLLNKQEASFYFYNPQLVIQGKQNYLSKWGNRPNIDNWRSSLAIENINQSVTENTKETTQTSAPFIDTPESYLSAIPKSVEAQDSIQKLNHNAYLQLGMIYKEKFKNFGLAKRRLEHLLNEEIAPEVKVQALYHLFRMYDEEKAPLAERYKKQLLEGFPETPFARLISDPENFDNAQFVTPEALYAKTLKLYQNQEFTQCLASIESLLILASGSRIEPKTALLKAHIIGRLQGVEAWKNALEEVAANYSAVEEGLKAKEVLEEIETFDDLKETGVVYKNYKWIFPFGSDENERSLAFFENLKKALSTTKQNWSVSIDPFDDTHTFVVVHGIRDLEETTNGMENQRIMALIKENKENFVALASQYRTLIKNKNWKNFQDERNRY